MFLAILGLVDIVAGIYLIVGINYLAKYLGIFILLKAISSLIGSFATKFFFDFMGILDLIVGLSLIFSWNIPWIGILILIKGVYSLIFGMIK